MSARSDPARSSSARCSPPCSPRRAASPSAPSRTPSGPGNIDLGWFAYPITVVYLVAYTNIINLIDGLDGLATGITAIAALAMFSLAVLAGRTDAAALSIALFGGCLAFLRYNFNPASVFLGDSGSLLLGFALGTVSLLSVNRTAALTSLIIPLIVAGVPILDTFAAIIRRTRAHVSIGQADKGHIQHRLIQEGYDQRQAVLLIYAWCILLALGAVLINQVRAEFRVVIFLVLLGGSAVFAMRLHLFEPVHSASLQPRNAPRRDRNARGSGVCRGNTGGKAPACQTARRASGNRAAHRGAIAR